MTFVFFLIDYQSSRTLFFYSLVSSFVVPKPMTVKSFIDTSVSLFFVCKQIGLIFSVKDTDLESSRSVMSLYLDREL